VAASAPRTIDHASRLPLYAQLEAIIAAQLASGELKPGDMLPTEAQLCEQHRLSRTVVRQAVGGLVTNGRLYRVRGKGTFVSGRALDERILRPTLGFFDDLTAAGIPVSNQLVSLTVIGADETVAAALAVAVTTRCVRLERIRRVHADATAFMRSFFPESLHPRMLARLRSGDVAHTSLHRLLEQATGIRPHAGHRWVQAVVADADLAVHLACREGAALLYVESIEDDATGRRIEYSQAWHRGDRTRFELESSTPDP
jgi:GntR family transcriptional regulator